MDFRTYFYRSSLQTHFTRAETRIR